MTAPVTLFEVGGCVRDSFLGIESHDIDFTVEADSYDTLRAFLHDAGFTIFLEKPEYLTIRARFPKIIVDPAIPTRFAGQRNLPTADFVLARKDGVYTDGRRPDEVIPGTIFDDLARRDFTVNAMARDKDGAILDPHDGQADLANGILRAVGDPEARLREDALRALRAIRFMVTKGFDPAMDLWDALSSAWLPPLLAKVEVNRRRDELGKMFHANTIESLAVLRQLPDAFTEAVFTDGLWLKPTTES